MLTGRSSAARLARGLRGFASKKKPDFYKSAPTSEPAATGKNPAAQQAADASAASKSPQGTAEAANPAAGAPAPPAVAAAAQPSAAAASPAVSRTSTASAAPKPVPPAAPSSASARAPQAAAPRAQPAAKPTASNASAAAKPASPAGSAPAAAQAAKPAAPAGSAPTAAASSAEPAAAAGGGPGAPGGSSGNGWLLHPAVPVDVRLLTGGLVGAAALAYTLTGGDDKPQAPKPAAVIVEESGFTMQPEAAAEADADEAAAAAAQATVEEAVEEALAEVAAEEAAGAAAGAAGAAEPAARADEEAAEGEPIYVDASKVLGVIEEVFSQEATEQLAALEAQAAAQAAQAADAGEQKVADAGRTAAEAAAAAPAPTEPPAAGGEAQQAAGRQRGKAAGGSAAARLAEEKVAAIQAAMADQAGEAVASDFVQSRPNTPSLAALAQGGKKVAPEAPAQRAQPAEPAEPTEPAEPSPDAAARTKQLLGLQQDLSAAGLIAEATRLGIGPSQDFSDYQQRHRQAEADAVVLSRLLESAGQHVAAQLAAARAEAEAGRAEAAAARRQLAKQAEHFRVLLKEALDRAEQQQRQQLRRQAEQLTAAHAEMTVHERVERSAKLDAVRERVNALEAALRRRSDEQHTSHEAHQLALAAFALRSALAAGGPLGEALGLLQGLAERDPVVAAAVRAMPAGAAAAPVPTRAQLSDRFVDVARLSRQLSMLPEGQGGMLSLAVAKLAAALKLAERGPLAATLPGDGIDRRLAAAQQAVVDGKLLAAAAELESAVRGTAAAPVVAAWAAAVKARAAAEQSAALLEAHAAAESASLA